MPAKKKEDWKQVLSQMDKDIGGHQGVDDPNFGRTLMLKGYRWSSHNKPSTVKDFSLTDVLRMLEENRKTRRKKTPLKGLFGGGS